MMNTALLRSEAVTQRSCTAPCTTSAVKEASSTGSGRFEQKVVLAMPTLPVCESKPAALPESQKSSRPTKPNEPALLE